MKALAFNPMVPYATNSRVSLFLKHGNDEDNHVDDADSFTTKKNKNEISIRSKHIQSFSLAFVQVSQTCIHSRLEKITTSSYKQIYNCIQLRSTN